MTSIKISEETFNLLCQLRKKVPAKRPAEIVEWLAEWGATDIGIVVDANDVEVAKPPEDTPKFENNEQLRQNEGGTISSELRDSVVLDILPQRDFAPIFGETTEITTNRRHRSQTKFSNSIASQLVNVKPSRAFVQGTWFKITYWNRAVFATIKALVNDGVAVEEIAQVLSPFIKIGNPEGSVPIKRQNISHKFINTPRISWECIEKLYNYWDIDVRVRFRWTEKGPDALRGRTYEVRTGLPSFVELTE